MGEVWRGRHRASALPVAIKTLSAERLRTPRNRELFAAEVEAVARLSHPGIVHIFDHGVVSAESAAASGGRLVTGSAYLVMELASEGNLASSPPRDWPALRAALEDVLDALAHAHARGLVHRDLKPANVLRAGQDDLRPGLKLADFGAVWRLDVDRGPAEGRTTIGTPQYMAPEQIIGREHTIGPATDLYALGCLAWLLATGEAVFPSTESLEVLRSHLREAPSAFVPRMPVPGGLEGWLRRLLQKDARARFPTAAAARHALDALAGAPTAASGAPLAAAAFDQSTALLPHDGLTQESVPRIAAVPGVTGDPGGPVERDPVPATWRTHDELPPLPLVDAGLGLFGLRQLPLLGRESLQDLLWDELVQVGQSGSGRVVLLQGRPGEGKSRLARWLLERSRELGAASGLVVRSDAGRGAGSGFAPALRRALRARAQESAVLDAAEEHLLRHGELNEDELRRLTHLALPEATIQGVRGETGYRTTQEARFATFARYLEREARLRAVVLWIDDLQWSVDGLLFLEWFLRRQETTPSAVLTVATVRSDLAAAAPFVTARLAELAGLGARRVTVPPLDGPSTRRLVTELLHLTGDLAEQVSERSGGTPLFAVQLVGDWVARGLLRATDDGFALVDGAEPRVPDGVLQLFRSGVESALQGLPLSARREVELAAALGDPADDDELDAATEALGLDSPQAMEALARRGLVFRTRAGWEFAHVLLVESIAQDAEDAGRWWEAHSVCARVLTERGADPARIGRHLVGAGQLDDALEPMLRGIDRALDRAEYLQARGLVDEREEVVGRLRLDSRDPRHVAGELWRLRVHWRLPDLAAVLPRLDALEQAVRGDGDSALLASVLLVKARTLCILLRIDDSWAALQELEPLAHLLESDLEEFDLRILRGELAARRGDTEGSLALRAEGVRWAEELGNSTFLGTFLMHIGYLLLWEQRLDEAADAATRLLDLGGRGGDVVHEAAGAALLGAVAHNRGDLEESLLLLRRSHDLYAAAGHYSQFILLNNLAGLLLKMQRYAEARIVARRAERAFAARGEQPRVALCQLLQAAGFGHDGLWEPTIERLTRARETLAPCTTAQQGTETAHDLADTALTAGRTDVARLALEVAVQYHERGVERGRLEEARGRLEALSAP